MPQPIASRKTRRPRPARPHWVSAFTLVEILIVVVILGILAAIVVPQFVSAAAESRESSIKMDLNRVRQQLEVYRQQHNGEYPALATFADQLTKPTDAAGNTNAAHTPTFKFGPYIRELPINPSNGLSTVTADAPGNSGWYYNEATGEFRANDSAGSRQY